MTGSKIVKSSQEEKRLSLISRFEVNNTLILAIATLAITWCSYQSSLWNGIQSFSLATANGYNRRAQELNLVSGQKRLMDEQISINFVHAVLDGRNDKTEFYLQRIRPELSNILAKWQESGPLEDSTVPAHPMAMPAYQQMVKDDMKESNALRARAENAMKEAQQANRNADNYTLFTVIFSMVMFLGALATKVSGFRMGFTLMFLAGGICLVLLVLLFFNMPITHR